MNIWPGKGLSEKVASKVNPQWLVFLFRILFFGFEHLIRHCFTVGLTASLDFEVVGTAFFQHSCFAKGYESELFLLKRTST